MDVRGTIAADNAADNADTAALSSSANISAAADISDMGMRALGTTPTVLIEQRMRTVIAPDSSVSRVQLHVLNFSC